MNPSKIDLEQLSRYMEGDLGPAETWEVEHLLAESSETRAQMENLRNLLATLGRLPDRAPPPGFLLRLEERIAARRSLWRRAWDSLLLRSFPSAVRTAAVVAVLLLALGAVAWQLMHPQLIHWSIPATSITRGLGDESERTYSAPGFSFLTPEDEPDVSSEDEDEDLFDGFAALFEEPEEWIKMEPDELQQEDSSEELYLETYREVAAGATEQRREGRSRLETLGALSIGKQAKEPQPEAPSDLSGDRVRQVQPPRQMAMRSSDRPEKRAPDSQSFPSYGFTEDELEAIRLSIKSANPLKTVDDLIRWFDRQGWKWGDSLENVTDRSQEFSVWIPAEQVEEVSERILQLARQIAEGKTPSALGIESSRPAEAGNAAGTDKAAGSQGFQKIRIQILPE